MASPLITITVAVFRIKGGFYLLNSVSDPFIVATIYLLKNKVSPEKKYHSSKNKIGFRASIPTSEFLTPIIFEVSNAVAC